MVKQGSIIKTDLSPTKGHEQTGFRPALVVSSTLFTSLTNLTLICPITNTDRNHPLHVKLKDLKTTGFVMTDQIRAIDLKGRKFVAVERVSKGTFVKISNLLKASVDLSEDFE